MAGPPAAPRFDAAVSATLAVSPPAQGVTANISLTGVLLCTKARPRVGTIAQLSLQHDNAVMTCATRVVRHASGGVGLVFVGGDEAFYQGLSRMLERASAWASAVPDYAELHAQTMLRLAALSRSGGRGNLD